MNEPSALLDVSPSTYPSALFASVVRSQADTIREVAASDPDAWTRVDVVDPFVELVSADDLAAQLPATQRASVTAALADLAEEPAEVRLCVTWTPRAGDGAWVLLAWYASEADVPEHPAGWTWIAPEREVPLPSLRAAVGLDPFNANTLARWALATGDAQTWAAAALVIEAISGLVHDPLGPVVKLLAALDGRGLRWFMSEGGFDAEHRTAVEVALALRAGLAEWPAVAPVEPVAEAEVEVSARHRRGGGGRGVTGEPCPIAVALASDSAEGWRRPERYLTRRPRAHAEAA